MLKSRGINQRILFADNNHIQWTLGNYVSLHFNLWFFNHLIYRCNISHFEFSFTAYNMPTHTVHFMPMHIIFVNGEERERGDVLWMPKYGLNNMPACRLSWNWFRWIISCRWYLLLIWPQFQNHWQLLWNEHSWCASMRIQIIYAADR